MNNKGQEEIGWMFFIGFILLIIFGAFIFGGPPYGVWAKALEGEAELKHAEFSKQVAIQEAHAKMESSKLLAQAEVERAKGVAEANKIIGASLKENEDYLRYLWIIDVAGANTDKTVVYVPTETNLPILEAARGLK